MVYTPYVDKHIYRHSFHWWAILMLEMFGKVCNKICISKQYAWCIYNEQTEHSWMKKELLLFLFTSVTKPEVQDTGTAIYQRQKFKGVNVMNCVYQVFYNPIDAISQ